MLTLFLTFHGFRAYNGISKKIQHQIDALRQCGLEVRTCRYEVLADGSRCWMVEDKVIANLGKGPCAKVRKRIDFSPILRYVADEKVKFVYIRSYHNANPFTIHLVKRLKLLGVKLALEIPTYPYDQEYISQRMKLTTDRLFRRKLCSYIDRIVTFSDDAEIFGCPTIRISNGIDFSRIPLRQPSGHDLHREVHLIGVAEIHYWHGFDRLIEGLARYYAQCRKAAVEVHFHLVGTLSGEREKREILTPIRQHHLEPYVHLHGNRSGKELDALFNQSDFAIGSLGRHRSGITHIRTLKNREYAARGFAFVYSEADADFDTRPYVLKAPADESPIDIPRLIRFTHQVKQTPAEIRESVSHLSWVNQMRQVVLEINKLLWAL